MDEDPHRRHLHQPARVQDQWIPWEDSIHANAVQCFVDDMGSAVFFAPGNTNDAHHVSADHSLHQSITRRSSNS